MGESRSPRIDSKVDLPQPEGPEIAIYSPFRIFLPISTILFLLGVLNYAYTYITEGRFTNMSALMFTSALIVFLMGLISEQVSQIGFLRQQVGPRENSASSVDSNKNRPD